MRIAGLVGNRGEWLILILPTSVHLLLGKSDFNPPCYPPCSTPACSFASEIYNRIGNKKLLRKIDTSIQDLMMYTASIFDNRIRAGWFDSKSISPGFLTERRRRRKRRRREWVAILYRKRAVVESRTGLKAPSIHLSWQQMNARLISVILETG